MAYMAMDFAVQTFNKSRWRYAQSPTLRKKFDSDTMKKNKIAIESTKQEKSSFFGNTKNWMDL